MLFLIGRTAAQIVSSCIREPSKVNYEVSICILFLVIWPKDRLPIVKLLDAFILILGIPPFRIEPKCNALIQSDDCRDVHYAYCVAFIVHMISPAFCRANHIQGEMSSKMQRT